MLFLPLNKDQNLKHSKEILSEEETNLKVSDHLQVCNVINNNIN